MRDKFVFKRLYYSVISVETPRVQSELLRAICEYALDGKRTSSISDRAENIFSTIKPHLTKANIYYINGKKGGAPKGSANNPKGRAGKKDNVNGETKEDANNVLEVETTIIQQEEEQKPVQSKQKIKLSKEELNTKIKEKKQKFAETLRDYIDVYGKDLLNQFYEYWTEPNKSNTKIKWELEKTWDIKRRLERWSRNYIPTSLSSTSTVAKKDNFSVAEQAINNNPFND